MIIFGDAIYYLYLCICNNKYSYKNKNICSRKLSNQSNIWEKQFTRLRPIAFCVMHLM